eukprot:jgi/Mesen1/2265/ME000154S01437
MQREAMTEALLTSLTMDNPSTSLTIDTCQHDDQDLFRHTHDPPDINLPLSMDINSLGSWASPPIHSLSVSLSQPLQPLKLSTMR